MLTTEVVKEAVAKEFAKHNISMNNVYVINDEITHNTLGVPYVTCGDYKILQYDGTGLTAMGDGVVRYNVATNIISDTTTALATERRFSNITSTVFSVFNMNMLARARNVEPEELLEVYVDYAVEDHIWKSESAVQV